MAYSLQCGYNLRCEIKLFDLLKSTRHDILRYWSSRPVPAAKGNKRKDNVEMKGEFRVLVLKPPKIEKEKKRVWHIDMKPPRTNFMSTDQDWTNVWPGIRTFHPAVVPLPIRQGCMKKGGPPPDKVANTELMKIPNFLHLTPPAIEKHCKALKQFCTEWPKELETEEDMEKHFPLEVIDSDYCHSSPTIRDPKARIMTIRIKLKNLKLDKHAKDKFLRLVGPRYDPETDYVTITTDSCPLKKQNYDYAHYLLTALYFESWKVEKWESEKSADDMENYVFENRQSRENVVQVFNYNGRSLPELKDFKRAVQEWHNNGDSKEVISQYKEKALKLLSLPVL